MKTPFYVLFDLDDTILDFHTAEHRALKRALSELGAPHSPEVLARYSEINRLCWQQLEKGLMSRADVMVKRFEQLFSELDFEGDTFETQEIYEKYLSERHFFMPGAEQLLKTLYGRYPLCIVSNGNAHTQAARLKSAAIEPYFQGIFISEDLGCDKPSRAFFEACFECLPDFSRNRALLVGDSLSSDILGAKNAGIKSCWFNVRGESVNPDIAADYEIRSLSELPALLERLEKETQND